MMSWKRMQKDNRRATANHFVGQFCVTGRDAVHEKLPIRSAFRQGRRCAKNSNCRFKPAANSWGLDVKADLRMLGIGYLLTRWWCSEKLGFLGHDDPARKVKNYAGQKSAKHSYQDEDHARQRYIEIKVFGKACTDAGNSPVV